MTHATTSTGWCSSKGTIVGTGLGSVGTVLEDVAGRADISARADKDACVHVRGARRADDAEAVSVHVDLARHIDHTPLAKGELHPGVAGLAVDELSVRVDGGASARGAVSEVDHHRGAGGDRSGDGGLNCVDPRAGDTPADKDDVFTSIVDEVGLPWVAVALAAGQPGKSVGNGRVHAQVRDTETAESAGVGIAEGGGTLSISGPGQYTFLCNHVTESRGPSYCSTWLCLRAWLWAEECWCPMLAAYAWPAARVASTMVFIEKCILTVCGVFAMCREMNSCGFEIAVFERSSTSESVLVKECDWDDLRSSLCND